MKNLNLERNNDENDSDQEEENGNNSSDDDEIEGKKKEGNFYHHDIILSLIDYLDQIQIWQHSTSDILARLRALGAYSYCQKQNISTNKNNKNNKNNKKDNKKKNKNNNKLSNTELIEKNTLQLCKQLGLHDVGKLFYKSFLFVLLLLR